MMRSTEFIMERLNKTFLFEMAHDQHAAKIIVTSASPQIFEHLVKIYSIKSSPERIKYWIKEINNKWLKRINDVTLKPKNKRLSCDLLTTWMMEDSAPTYNLDHLKTVLKSLKYEYGNDKVKNMNLDQLLARVNSMMTSVCERIADGTFIHLGEYIDADNIVTTSPFTKKES